MKPHINYHLYLVTDEVERCRYGLVETVKRAVEGGVTLVQYRSEKLTISCFAKKLIYMR